MRRFVDQVEDKGIAVPEEGGGGVVRPEFRGVGLGSGLGQPEWQGLLGTGEEMERFCELDLKRCVFGVVETHHGVVELGLGGSQESRDEGRGGLTRRRSQGVRS